MVIIWLIDSDYNLKLLKEKFEQDKIVEYDVFHGSIRRYCYKNIKIDLTRDIIYKNPICFNKIYGIVIGNGFFIKDIDNIIQVGIYTHFKNESKHFDCECFGCEDFNYYEQFDDIKPAILYINDYCKENNKELPEIFNENLLTTEYSEKKIRDILLYSSFPEFEEVKEIEEIKLITISSILENIPMGRVIFNWILCNMYIASHKVVSFLVCIPVFGPILRSLENSILNLFNYSIKYCKNIHNDVFKFIIIFILVLFSLVIDILIKS